MDTWSIARLGLLVSGVTIAASSFSVEGQTVPIVSPIYGVSLPVGYRQWELVGPARESAPLNELRVVLGNSVAVAAYKRGTLPFPDGTILVKLAWKDTQSEEFESASVPGAATTIQVMVKDSKRYLPWVAGALENSSTASQPIEHNTRLALFATRRA